MNAGWKAISVFSRTQSFVWRGNERGEDLQVLMAQVRKLRVRSFMLGGGGKRVRGVVADRRRFCRRESWGAWEGKANGKQIMVFAKWDVCETRHSKVEIKILGVVVPPSEERPKTLKIPDTSQPRQREYGQFKGYSERDHTVLSLSTRIYHTST